ncbi:MAG: DNA primase [Coriobacteriia bacterium]|nr:DNA primase [Coriobacteriia bacterium]
MGRISDEDVRRVRDATDLVSLVGERVVLKQKGRLFWGNCPFHQEKTPSFKIDPATQLWHCFGCGLGGDAYGFVMRTESVDFGESIRILADRAHIEIAEEAGGVPRSFRERLIAATEAAANFYHDNLTKSPEAGAAKARDYLKKRGFGSDVARNWRLGYAPGRSALTRHLTKAGFTAEEIVGANLALKADNGQLKDRFYERIMFPITDLQGRYIAFGGRVVGTGEPKYLNTQDTPIFHKSANMYGIDRAKALITSSGAAIVVEGYTDVIALHEAGVANAVATLGTALTREHVRLLSRFAKRVVYLFDGDAAGLRAADRASEFIDKSITPEAGRERIELFVAVIPGGQDPADLVTSQGPEALAAAVDDAAPLLQFSIDRRFARWDLDRPEERSRALKEAAEVLAPIKDSLLADDYATYIADKLFADVATVKRAIGAARPSNTSQSLDDSQPEAPAAPIADTPQVRLERDLLDLLVRTPRLRARARFLLSENLLTEPVHRAIAEGIEREGVEVPADELAGRLEASLPGVAAVLSGAQLGEVADADADAAERDMVRKLKEFDLERRIAIGKARLKQPGSFTDPAEYDDLFKNVSALQRELEEYRSGVRDVG